MRWTGATRYLEADFQIHTREDVTRIFIHAIGLGASDVIFQTGRPVLALIDDAQFALDARAGSIQVMSAARSRRLRMEVPARPCASRNRSER